MGTWVVPLAIKRASSQEDKELVGAEQVRAVLEDNELPFRNALCVEVGDSAYSKPAFLNANRDKPNLITITRVRGREFSTMNLIWKKAARDTQLELVQAPFYDFE